MYLLLARMEFPTYKGSSKTSRVQNSTESHIYRHQSLQPLGLEPVGLYFKSCLVRLAYVSLSWMSITNAHIPTTEPMARQRMDMRALWDGDLWMERHMSTIFWIRYF